MNNTNSDFQTLDNSYIDISELKKEFNAKDFAKSLLPNWKISDEDETDATFYGDFLEDLEKKVESTENSSGTTNKIECFRTWSHIRFKEKKVSMTTEKTCEVSEPQVENYQIEVLKERKQARNFPDVLHNFLEEEKKSKVLISNLKFNHDPVDLPLIESANKKFFRFYYIDAYEKLFGEETTVYLFGKTYCPQSELYKSCCVAVHPLKRRLFLLPRQCVAGGNADIPAKVTHMLKEVYKLALEPLNIKKFNYRFVKKKTLEGIFLPVEQMMLEIEYSAYYPAVDHRLEGSTFSKIFGAKNNCFENFLLENLIRGPCWLDVSNPKKAIKPKTWCFFEVSCSTEDISLCQGVNKSASPPLTLISFHIRSVDQSNNIALLSWAVNYDFDIWKENFSIVEEKSYCTLSFVNTDKDRFELPEISKAFRRTKIRNMNSEKDMLKFFLSEFNEIEPDIVVCYDMEDKEFHKFVDRLESLKIDDHNKLGKFRVKGSSSLRKFLFSGRLVCDLRHLAKEFALSRNYELDELYEKFLVIDKGQRWFVELGGMVSSTGKFCKTVELREKFLEIIVISTNEPLYLLKLVLKTNIIPLAVKLTEICGNVLSQTLTMGITKRSEYLLLHPFYEQNFIVPNKMFSNKSKNLEEDEVLEGGLVLEPKIGFYDNYILLMDFQSLYPSIILEYNLCISHNEFDNSSGTDMPLGILPKLMRNFIEKRRIVKDRMKSLNNNSIAFFRYQIYQTALKLSANSIYGCLAYHHFRFYTPSIAQGITRRAREILSNTVHSLKSKGFEIIYGDTDSVMVNTNCTDLLYAREMGRRIGEIVNANFSSIHLRIDTIFKKLLIIAKKKYAGIAADDVRILKGLDIIRYDWPNYVCQIGKLVIDIILSDNPLPERREKIKEQLGRTKKELLNNEVPIESLVITKYLTQHPENYSEETSHPHVQVALRCNKNSLCNLKSGDAVFFIMCCDKNGTFSQKAYHLKELKSLNGWVIDASYYLHKQIFPFISKICTFIELGSAEIEQFLCLDRPKKIEEPKSYRIEFEKRNPFIFNCLKCGIPNILDANGNVGSLDKCQNVECDYCPLKKLSYLENKLVATVSSYIKQYYKCELKCTKCFFTTFRIPLRYTRERNKCIVCGKGAMVQIFNESDLFLQLEYFKFIFNYGLLSTSDEKKKDALKSLIQTLCYYDKHSGFLSVDLTKLFCDL